MARNFANATDQIHYGAETVPDGITDGCISFWLKTGAVALQHVASHWSNISRNGWGILLNNTANKLTFTAYSGTQQVNLASTSSVNNGAWRHVLVNFSRANGGANSIYIDGTQEATGNSGAAWPGTGYYLVFGDSFDAFWSTIVADVAEIGYWSAQLSAAEIAALAKGFAPKLIRPASMLLHAPLAREARSITGAFVGGVTGTTVSDHPRMMGGAV